MSAIPAAPLAAPPAFDPASAPVAVALDAHAVLGCDAFADRAVARLESLALVSQHVSVHLDGAPASCADAAEHLASALPDALFIARRLTSVDVNPRCPLLAPEAAGCLWSPRGLRVPPETAWLPLEIPVDTGAGIVDPNLLGDTLDAAVEDAERLFDSARWPTPAMQRDAWLNRRLAIEPVGLRELYRDHDYSLSALHRLLGWIGARLQATSARMAKRVGPLPSIRATNPAVGMPSGSLRRAWEQRWRAALDSTAVRNRTLLAIDVSRLVDESASSGSTALLPLVSHADAVMVPPAAPAWAEDLGFALHQRRALDQIAKSV